MYRCLRRGYGGLVTYLSSHSKYFEASFRQIGRVVVIDKRPSDLYAWNNLRIRELFLLQFASYK